MFDTRDMDEVAQSNLDILVIFLIIVAIIAITLAFFLLLLSNISNIRENVWEFGILRYEECLINSVELLDWTKDR